MERDESRHIWVCDNIGTQTFLTFQISFSDITTENNVNLVRYELAHFIIFGDLNIHGRFGWATPIFLAFDIGLV